MNNLELATKMRECADIAERRFSLVNESMQLADRTNEYARIVGVLIADLKTLAREATATWIGREVLRPDVELEVKQ